METKNTLLILAISGILAACGSSSSQGTTESTSGTTSSSSTGGATSSGTTSSSTTSGSTSSSTTTESGYMVRDNTTSGQSANPYIVSVEDDGDGDLNTITINGQNITLIPGDTSSSGFTTIGNRIVSGTRYAYVKFGVNDDSSNFALFAQGYATDVNDVPTSGTATYLGHAVGAVDEVSNAFTTGDASVAVDFGNQSLTGTLSNWADSSVKTMTFTANISGNTFTNTSTTKVSGMFYGDNAAEMGGVVNTTQDGNAAVASFGAIKQ